jgi:hypothetical protein
MTKYEAMFLKRGDSFTAPDGTQRTVSAVLTRAGPAGSRQGLIYWVTPYMAAKWAECAERVTIRDTNGRLWDCSDLAIDASLLTERMKPKQRGVVLADGTRVYPIMMTEEYGFTFAKK